MTKNPPHRPKNRARIESMLLWYETALQDSRRICGDEYSTRDEYLKELFDSKEFPPHGLNITPMEEFELVSKALPDDDDMATSEVKERIKDWHEIMCKITKPLSRKLRGDKMIAYRIAAGLFNAQLADDQRGDEFLDIKPRRLNEKPITPSALERAINREKKLQAAQNLKHDDEDVC